jgi:hypothetical protein
MREKLRGYIGAPRIFTARFKMFGIVGNYHKTQFLSALMVEVKANDGEEVTDHIWVVPPPSIERSGPKPGDEVYFLGKVNVYWKRAEDYSKRLRSYGLIVLGEVSKLE